MVTNAGVAPPRSIAQSEKRAWRTVRDFDPNHRCRSRNGTSAWRSRIPRMSESKMPSQSAPTSIAGSVSIRLAAASVLLLRGAICETCMLSPCSRNQ